MPSPFDKRPAFPPPPLSPEEERIIVHKGTEAPFSGKYNLHFTPGYYLCRRCGSSLFSSADKFASTCGWPAFERALPGAVVESLDIDGRRMEITCAVCSGHLGHVFRGEGLTSEGVRHCVNSVSLSFSPDLGAASAAGLETAIFAAGCFWGVEHAFRAMQGVVDAVSGYTGGSVPNPSYEAVCSGNTGHAEAVRVLFDPRRTPYAGLARMFFEIHDPTQYHRQGPDVGEQYRSAVFYLNEEQKTVVEALIERLRRDGLDVVTEVLPAGVFYPAEEYHQGFFLKHPQRAACAGRMRRF